MSQTFNQLRVDVVEEKDDWIGLRIFVDGWPFGPKACVDPADLRESAFGSGKYYILTCGCGTPECADIEDPIIVRYEDRWVIWDCDDRYYPYIADRNDINGDVSPKFIRYRFLWDEYERSVRKALFTLREKIKAKKYEGIAWYGFNPAILDELMPRENEQ